MKRLLLIAALMTAAVPAVASAQRYPDYGRPAYGGRGDQDAARDAVRGGRQVPLSTVIANIAARTPGRQLNTTQGEAGGRPAYFVQWQTHDGRVIIFVVDAQSGQIISRQGG
jgi:uncharacterized membrane protein YkoI